MKIKFRYRFTGIVDGNCKNKPLYKTAFQDRNGIWRSIESKILNRVSVFPPIETYEGQRKIDEKSPYTDECLFNYYEYEVDIAEMENNLIATRALLYCLLYREMNDKYLSVCTSYKDRLNGYSGNSYDKFKLDLQTFFPKIYQDLPAKMYSLLDTFYFILHHVIDFKPLYKNAK